MYLGAVESGVKPLRRVILPGSFSQALIPANLGNRPVPATSFAANTFPSVTLPDLPATADLPIVCQVTPTTSGKFLVTAIAQVSNAGPEPLLVALGVQVVSGGGATALNGETDVPASSGGAHPIPGLAQCVVQAETAPLPLGVAAVLGAYASCATVPGGGNLTINVLSISAVELPS